MNILVLNGSPRPNGKTIAMIDAFREGASETGHQVSVIDVCRKKISGCLGCEYCHSQGNGNCIQKDDMKEVYTALNDADMIVIASPIYYFSFSGQLQCAINRMYAQGIPKNLKKSMLILSSGSDDVYNAAIYQYKKTFIDYMKLEDMGVFKAFGKQNKSEVVLSQLRNLGKSL